MPGGASANSLQAQQRNLCRSMAEVFSDPMRAEEGLQQLAAIKDNNIFRLLSNLMCPSTTLAEALATQVSRRRLHTKGPTREGVLLFHLRACFAGLREFQGQRHLH